MKTDPTQEPINLVSDSERLIPGFLGDTDVLGVKCPCPEMKGRAGGGAVFVLTAPIMMSLKVSEDTPALDKLPRMIASSICERSLRGSLKFSYIVVSIDMLR